MKIRALRAVGAALVLWGAYRALGPWWCVLAGGALLVWGNVVEVEW